MASPGVFAADSRTSIAAQASGGAFTQTGAYLTFMRMPAQGLGEWKDIVDCIREDGGNTMLLWMGGGFRSRKFPVTWQFNRDHRNIRHDFVRELIAHAHRRGVRVVLALTPFGYDGVNQFPMEHPELKALKPDGSPVAEFGIDCWGWNLCPSKPASQQFMLEYAREMLFDFYPEADGLMLESSDYGVCQCPECRGRYFEKEFTFVRQISDELWAARPGSQIIVYPHYFSGRKVRFAEASGARLTFDPRWTLFFTPHSAEIEPGLLRQANGSIWWNEGHAFCDPRQIVRGARQARAAGCTGYIPSMESFSYVPSRTEEGQPWIVGRRQVPLGFGWLPVGRHPYRELPARVTRITYREVCRNPETDALALERVLSRELLGPGAGQASMEKLLTLQKVFSTERTWSQPPPLAAPGLVRARRAQGRVSPDQLALYRRQLQFAEALADEPVKEGGKGGRDMQRIGRWLVRQWKGEVDELLGPGLPDGGQGPALEKAVFE